MDLQQSDAPSADLLKDVPADIAQRRAALFHLKEEVILSRVDHDRIWPYVDNVWGFNTRTDVRSKDQGWLEYFCCKKYRGTLPSTSRGKRRRAILDIPPCSFILKKDFIGDVVKIRRHGKKAVCHNHTLEDSDRWKVNGGLKAIVVEAVARGCPCPVVHRNIQALDEPRKRQRLLDAGGENLDWETIYNASRACRARVPLQNTSPTSPPSDLDITPVEENAEDLKRSNNIQELVNEIKETVDTGDTEKLIRFFSQLSETIDPERLLSLYPT